jgi:hypothetical protein
MSVYPIMLADLSKNTTDMVWCLGLELAPASALQTRILVGLLEARAFHDVWVSFGVFAFYPSFSIIPSAQH